MRPAQPENKAENQPRNQGDKGGLEENRLRVGEIFDGVEGDDVDGEPEGLVADAGARRPLLRRRPEEVAAVGRRVKEATGIADAHGGVEEEGIHRARSAAGGGHGAGNSPARAEKSATVLRLCPFQTVGPKLHLCPWFSLNLF